MKERKKELLLKNWAKEAFKGLWDEAWLIQNWMKGALYCIMDADSIQHPLAMS